MAEYTLNKMLLSQFAAGRPGTIIKPKGLVIHWTANTDKGSDAGNNRNYFNNSGLAASAHYIIDDHQVVQCLPEKEMAYHVGAKSYKQNAIDKLSSYPNNCTIGVEICVNCDGDFQKTFQNTVDLTADICKRQGWTIENLWRHYDITGKDCPKFFVTDSVAKTFGFTSASTGWDEFKNMVKEEMTLRTVKVIYNGKSYEGFAKNGISYITSKLLKDMGKTLKYENGVVEVK